MSDYDDYKYSQEDIYRPSVYAHERVGLYGDERISNVIRMEHKKGHYYSPEENFELVVESMANSLDLTVPQLKILLPTNLSTKITNLRYLNAQAYVLGFIASNEGSKITKKSFKAATKHLGTMKIFDNTVNPEDILRYARFWINLEK